MFLYRKFSFTQNQKLCKLVDLWVFLFLQQHLSSRTSFQKQFLLILQNRKSLWKVPKKNTIYFSKRGHFYFQSGTKQSFNTIFSRLRSFVPKEMPVQQDSAFQLHNVNPCKRIDVLHQKEH